MAVVSLKMLLMTVWVLMVFVTVMLTAMNLETVVLTLWRQDALMNVNEVFCYSN